MNLDYTIKCLKAFLANPDALTPGETMELIQDALDFLEGKNEKE